MEVVSQEEYLLIFNFFKTLSSEAYLPIDFIDLELCMEWGITWNEYLQTPGDIIDKMKEYRQAKFAGIAAKEKQSESQRKSKERELKLKEILGQHVG